MEKYIWGIETPTIGPYYYYVCRVYDPTYLKEYPWRPIYGFRMNMKEYWNKQKWD